MPDSRLARGAHVFVDETKARDFILVGVWVAATDVGRARVKMRRLVPPGSRRVHFSKLSGAQRDAVLAAVHSCGFSAVEVRTSVRDQCEARSRTLRRMLEIAVESRASRVVIEQDHSFFRLDQGLASRMGLAVDHLRAPDDPLLWAADAIAWCIQRGGEWHEKVIDRIVLRSVV